MVKTSRADGQSLFLLISFWSLRNLNEKVEKRTEPLSLLLLVSIAEGVNVPPCPTPPPLGRAQRLCVGSHPGLCCFSEWAGVDAHPHCDGVFASCVQFCLLVEASLPQQTWGKYLGISGTPAVSPLWAAMIQAQRIRWKVTLIMKISVQWMVAWNQMQTLSYNSY